MFFSILQNSQKPVFFNFSKFPTKKIFKKTIFQDPCKSKNAKIKKTSRKPKKTIFQDSCLLTLSPDFWNIGFFGCFGFFGFLEVFWIFAFSLLQESWNIGFFLFFWFFWFSRGFLNFGIFTFAGVLEYCFFCFFWFSRGFLEL